MPNKSRKLFDAIKNSPNNHSREELIRLYEGYGFIIEPGSKHDKISHPDDPKLVTTLPRHGKLSPPYFRAAIKLIETLESLQRQDED